MPKLWGEDRLFPWWFNSAASCAPPDTFTRSIPTAKTGTCGALGFRNPYDIAFNRHGDLFTFDSDMESDMNPPWYRPTRVCLATSGSDFGLSQRLRQVSAALPDTLPAIYDIGPGSPTGMSFGYGAKFPAKYQEALFICDWSYGRLFAVHLTPDGSAYKAGRGGVPHWHAPADDRPGRQSQGRRPVFHHRRPQHAVGSVSRDLHRQGIDRAFQGRTTGAEAGHCGTSWRHSTARPTPAPSPPPGPTWATRTATSALPPEQQLSTRISNMAKPCLEGNQPRGGDQRLVSIGKGSRQRPTDLPQERTRRES